MTNCSTMSVTFVWFFTAYRSKYSLDHMIVRLSQEWEEKLDKRYFAGVNLVDLSKAFDCIPHDLLIAKLNAYGFGRKSLISFYSCLKRRKQCVNFNNIQNTFKTLLSGVSQGSVLEGNNALNKIQSTLKHYFLEFLKE